MLTIGDGLVAQMPALLIVDRRGDDRDALSRASTRSEQDVKQVFGHRAR